MKPSERWLQQVLDAMTEQIAVLDRHGNILMVNEAWRRFGRENGGRKPMGFGVNYLEVCRRAAMPRGESAEQAREVLEGLRRVLEGVVEKFQFEYPCHSPAQRRWFVLTATPLNGGTGGAVIAHLDITAAKLREMEILREAYEDPLTGLANRRCIEEEAVEVLAGVRRDGGTGAVLVIDLDGFKAVNDTFGHHAGDLVLAQVAERLDARTPATGLLARLGGDEFVALLTKVDARGAEAAVHTYLGTFSLPFSVGSSEVRLGGSIGFALYPEQGETFADLLQAADTAMYRAKSAAAARHSLTRGDLAVGGRKPKERGGGETWYERGRLHQHGHRTSRPWRLSTSRRQGR